MRFLTWYMGSKGNDVHWWKLTLESFETAARPLGRGTSLSVLVYATVDLYECVQGSGQHHMTHLLGFCAMRCGVCVGPGTWIFRPSRCTVVQCSRILRGHGFSPIE